MNISWVAALVLLVALCSCKHENNTPQANPGAMSGTWRYTQVNEYHNADTDEYIHTEYIESYLMVSEDASGIHYNSCWDYGKESYIGIKTDQYFYIDQGSTAFQMTAEGQYSTSVEERIQYSGVTDTYFKRHFELKKLSDELLLDKGLLVLSGPVDITEFSHVCLIKSYSNTYEDRSLNLVVPYDDSSLELRLGLLSTPDVGNTTYKRAGSGSVIYDFGITSNATMFWDIVGSNTLGIDSAEISITESNDSVLSGTYSFVDNQSSSYTGEFQIDLRE